MANIVLNDALGTFARYLDDGANVILVPLSAWEGDSTGKDRSPNDLATVLGQAGTTEQTGSTWARKSIANGSVTVTRDDTADLVKVLLPDQTWSSVAASNDTVALLVCIDGASDSVRDVILKLDFAVTTDGNDVTADFDATNGVWQSS